MNAHGLGRASVTQPLEGMGRGTEGLSPLLSEICSKAHYSDETGSSESSTGASVDSLSRIYECNSNVKVEVKPDY